MKALFTKTLANNVYTIILSIEEVDAIDTDLFVDFGEPAIDIGGEIKNALAATIATLPSQFRKIQSQTPVTQRFADSQYSGNAKAVAEAWITTIEGRINAAMTALRAKNDDFSGEQEIII